MIAVEGLRVAYGALTAVDGLSLDVPAGALVGLLGPNGAGKSTMIRCIAGLQRPDAGRIVVAGVDVSADPRAAKQLLGVVPQDIALYRDLTVAQNLSIFGGLFGLRGARLRDRAGWALEAAALGSKTGARVRTLSGGMQRRLNLVCGLLHEPPVIVCDEPTTGVDAQSRSHLFRTIQDLHRAGRTILYTTHYMEEVEALCERVAIVDHGRLIAADTLEALLQPDEGGGGGGAQGRRFEVALGAAVDVAVVSAALKQAGLDVNEVRAGRSSLEEVFLSLTGRSLRDEACP